MDQIYSAEQIQVPQELPGLIKAFTKEAIRYNPRDLVEFSRDYFKALADGQIEAFLAAQEKKKSEDVRQRAAAEKFGVTVVDS